MRDGGYWKALLRLGTFKYDRRMSENKRVVPDEAVEAAARVVLQYIDLQLLEHDRERKIPNEAARAILEAAAPYMLADVWEAGCRKGLSVNPGWEEQALASNPYRSQA